MTSIPETRYTQDRKPYTVLTSVQLATDPVYDKWFVEQLREFLYRRGINAHNLPDAQLLSQTRNTFANTNPRNGRITSANPVQSE